MCETSYTDTNSATGAAGKNVTDSGRIENIFGTSGQVHDYFIPKTYRTYQRETMGQIEDAFESGYRFVLVDAPTGSGKSHIARAFAFQAGSAHILTIQKLLQDQYERDFPDMFVMKGRSSYSCLLSDSGESCATGPCQRKKKEACPDCPYKLAKEEAVSAPVTVHNFDSFYYQNLMGGAFSGRKLLIVDEVHNSPRQVFRFFVFFH